MGLYTRTTATLYTHRAFAPDNKVKSIGYWHVNRSQIQPGEPKSNKIKRLIVLHVSNTDLGCAFVLLSGAKGIGWTGLGAAGQGA